jgi:hypothetical protein
LFAFAAGQVAQAEDERFADSIAHRCALALGFNQTCFAQDAEVLGGVGLLEAAGFVDVAHAAGAAAQAVQDSQAGGIGQSGEKPGHAVHPALVDSEHGLFYGFNLLPNGNISSSNDES